MRVLSRIYPPVMVFFMVASLIGCAIPRTNNLPDRKKTELGLYLTAKQTYELLKTDNQHILFIDIRTPAELSYSGKPKLIDANIPYLLFKKNENKVNKVVNSEFVPALEQELAKKNLDKQSTIILICREGRRSPLAVNALAKLGYQKVYSVIDGINGWQKGNFPWADYDFDSDI